MEEREEEREEMWAVSLQPAEAQEPRNFVREKGGSYSLQLAVNYYMNGLISGL